MSSHQHGYPWPSLATFPNRSSHLAGPQSYIPYPHRAVCSSWSSCFCLAIGVHHLWACPLLLQQCPACLVRLAYPTSYGLNSTTTVLLGECHWHWIAYKGWYAIKQRNQTKRKNKERSCHLVEFPSSGP